MQRNNISCTVHTSSFICPPTQACDSSGQTTHEDLKMDKVYVCQVEGEGRQCEWRRENVEYPRFDTVWS